MYHFSKKTKREYAVDLFFVVTFLFLMYFTFNKFGIYIQDGHTQRFIQSMGIFAPIVFCFVYLLTLVFAPIPGMPILVAGIGLFGPVYGIILLYFADILSCAINFFVARKFGRGVMRRLIGEKGLVKVDGHVSEFGVEMLILSRLFESIFFEWISYAAGLTKIDFKKFFIISVLGSVPERALIIFFALSTKDLGKMFVQLSFVNYVLMIMPFAYYFIKKIVSNRRRLSSV